MPPHTMSGRKTFERLREGNLRFGAGMRGLDADDALEAD